MTRAIIFDFDNCLCAGDEVPAALFEIGFEAIRRANRGALSEAALARAFDDCWRFALDDVARRHGFTDEMFAAGAAAFAAMEVTGPLKGYPDLCVLAELPGLKFLVTTGYRRLQESKIRALGVAHLFTGLYIDALGEPDRKGKAEIFREILDGYRLRPEEVVVVGDNPDSEIEAGNRLGLRTIQILRPGVSRGDNAHAYITDLHDLPAAL